MKCFCELWVNEQLVCYHTFNLPDVGEKGFYQEGVSADSFKSREAIRHYDAKGKILAKRARLAYPHDFFWKRQDLVTFHHKCLWDFYLAIGYDYKKQRYLK